MKIALVARIYRPHYIISKNKSQHVIVDSYASESVKSCIFEIALANAAAMTHSIENFGRHRPPALRSTRDGPSIGAGDRQKIAPLLRTRAMSRRDEPRGG